jgi:glycosyltransferase involved in cell wall biosynthesis
VILSAGNPNDRIRVVYLIGQLGLGGSERQLYLLLKHIDCERFDCRVIVFNPSPNETYEPALNALGIDVTRIPDDCKTVAGRVVYLYRKFREIRPHVVHSWTVHNNPYAGMVGRFTGVPVRLGSVRGSFLPPSENGLKRWFRKLFLFCVPQLVVNSDNLRAELERINYPESGVRIVTNCVEMDFNGLDDEARESLRTEFGFELESLIVGTVGNLRRVKNQEMFVEALAGVIRKQPNVRGLIVGHPISSEKEYEAFLRKKIRESGMNGRILITGFRSDVHRLMKAFDVFCLTSDSEGMPNVVLEAMAAGNPVVATRVGQLGNIIRDGIDGYLVAPGDVDAFSHSVRRLLRDPELSRKIGLAGRKTVARQFDCVSMAAQMSEIYLQTLSNKGFQLNGE